MQNLDDIALSQAVSMSVSIDFDIFKAKGDKDVFETAYESLQEAVNGDGMYPEGIFPWEPLENWSIEDILTNIEKDAKVFKALLVNTLDYAHKGLIQSAINDRLSSDANEWHLSMMVEDGLAIEQAGTL